MTRKTNNRVELTKCEAEVMEVVWDRQCVTVNDVVDSIDRNLAYTTVLTTMRILEDKGIVARGEKIGRALTYTAKVSRDQVRAGMLRALTDQLFGGSARSLVLSLIQSEAVSIDDIEAVKHAAAQLDDGQRGL
ncbi:Methicillin resistance regulatory protein MecI [Rubripirellula lacrimiformis]|uniref:Methicillin resistance regulatory protein MecI n=1 Tax=Rubripirellula lacrimiformis TaxID=1930273 RepID=A0A517NFL7_9BACT|nr:BlaI/MecI/CopY family transcriptional regulator [Rubripirellula lacrimiformis]QDT05917.1 Methicillin resistance regulatory protein MecI [Rubripirellula lacrimiformis]